MVSTSRWRIGGGKRPYDGVYSELYVIQISHYQFRCRLKYQFQLRFLFADKVKNAGNVTLLALMLLAIYNHIVIGTIVYSLLKESNL